MATALIDNILTGVFTDNNIDYSYPESNTSSETFTLNLSNSGDDIYILVDATLCAPGTYTLTFSKGDFSTAKAPEPISFADGYFGIIPIESGMIKKQNLAASFTIFSAVAGGLASSGLRLGVVKKRFVTNY